MEVGILWVYWVIDRYRLAKEKKKKEKRANGEAISVIEGLITTAYA